MTAHTAKLSPPCVANRASRATSHLAIAQDEMREDGEHRFAPRTLETPDNDPTEADSDVMGVAGQAPTRTVKILETVLWHSSRLSIRGLYWQASPSRAVHFSSVVTRDHSGSAQTGVLRERRRSTLGRWR
jgi:hypothetical protein